MLNPLPVWSSSVLIHSHITISTRNSSTFNSSQLTVSQQRSHTFTTPPDSHQQRTLNAGTPAELEWFYIDVIYEQPPILIYADSDHFTIDPQLRWNDFISISSKLYNYHLLDSHNQQTFSRSIHN